MPVCARCTITFGGGGTTCPSCAARATGVSLDEQGSTEPSLAPLSPEALAGADDPPDSRPTPDDVRKTPVYAFGDEDLPEVTERTPPPDPLIFARPLGQYEIIRKIGEGGFGAVYLADQVGV